jgi:transcriptional regulator with XRE-family HTH domain
MSVGKNIKNTRKKRKLTQVELAKMANISRSYLGDVENDRYNVSLEVLKQIAEALGTTASFLLGEEDPILLKINKDEEEIKRKIMDQLKLLTDGDGYFYEYLRKDVFLAISSNLYLGYAFQDSSSYRFYDEYFTTYYSSSPDEYPDKEHEEAMEMFDKYYELRTIKKALDSTDFDKLEMFNSSLDKIITEHNLKKKDDIPELTAKDERDIQKELQRMIDNLSSQSGYAAFDGQTLEDMDEEDRELLIASLENSLRIAKHIAKQKFTPKKYRK